MTRSMLGLFLLPGFLLLGACANETPLAHPTMPADQQRDVRRACEESVPQAIARAPNCPDIGGDRQALERCRADGDASLLAAARRTDAVAACLRRQGFR
jgi:hypothetical protein